MAKRVGVIIDDVILRALLCESIELNGFVPVEIFPSATVFDELRDRLVDALIVDVRLDESDPCWSLLDHVRRDSATAELAVILLTSDADRRRVERRTDGTSGWRLLRKPFGFIEVSGVLVEALGVAH
jgi:CheY-like chemotaxis protein